MTNSWRRFVSVVELPESPRAGTDGLARRSALCHHLRRSPRLLRRPIESAGVRGQVSGDGPGSVWWMSEGGDGWGLGPTFVTGKIGFVRAPLEPPQVPDSHGNRLWVGVPITTESPEGFPDDREAAQLANIEEDLLATVAKGLFVGVLTSAGMRDFYWYVESAQDIWTPQVAQRHSHHVIRSTVTPEPEHQTLRILSDAAAYADDDRRGVDELVSNGVDLQMKHPTDHHLLFPIEEQAARAVADLAGNAATINVEPSEDGSWLLVFSTLGYVGYQAVANDRATLDRIARHFGGTYDGWWVALPE